MLSLFLLKEIEKYGFLGKITDKALVYVDFYEKTGVCAKDYYF